MPKIDYVCCLLFRYVNVAEQTSYVQAKVRRSLSCVLGHNEKTEKGDARICYQSCRLPRSPNNFVRPVPHFPAAIQYSVYWPEILRHSLLPGSMKLYILQFAYPLPRILDTLVSSLNISLKLIN